MKCKTLRSHFFPTFANHPIKFQKDSNFQSKVFQSQIVWHVQALVCKSVFSILSPWRFLMGARQSNFQYMDLRFYMAEEVSRGPFGLCWQHHDHCRFLPFASGQESLLWFCPNLLDFWNSMICLNDSIRNRDRKFFEILKNKKRGNVK